MATRKITRRKFILTSGMAAAAVGAFPNFAFRNADPIRIGVIGTGARGLGIAALLRNRSDFSLVACCDILPNRLEESMAQAGKEAKGYADYRKLLDDKSVEAVVIASPLHLHYQMAVDALDAGKHVYCEKTMTYDIPQALQLSEKVNKSDRAFFVGHQYRSYPLYHRVYDAIEEGWCGDIKHFICHYNRNNNWRREVSDPALEKIINWRMYREYSGGLMAELSSHQIDVVNRFLNGHPTRITGFGGINRWNDGRETFDHASLIFEYENGVTGIVSSHLSNAHQPYLIKLIGTNGTIEIHREKAVFHFENTYDTATGVVDAVSGATMLKMKGESLSFYDSEEPEHTATDYAFSDFAESVHTGKKPASNASTGAATAIAVHMANIAMEEGMVQEWRKEWAVGEGR